MSSRIEQLTEYLTVREFARAVNYAPESIRQILRKEPGRIHHRRQVIGIDKGGREMFRYRIPTDEVERFLGPVVTVDDFPAPKNEEDVIARAYMILMGNK